jgi:hypothetical protein
MARGPTINLQVADNEHFYVAFTRWWEEDWSWEGLSEKARTESLGDAPHPQYGNLQRLWQGERLYQFGGRNWTRLHLPPMDFEGKLRHLPSIFPPSPGSFFLRL